MVKVCIHAIANVIIVHCDHQTAQDSGGPRKEFFRLALQKIQETFFGAKLRTEDADKYTTIGVIFGNKKVLTLN